MEIKVLIQKSGLPTQITGVQKRSLKGNKQRWTGQKGVWSRDFLGRLSGKGQFLGPNVKVMLLRTTILLLRISKIYLSSFRK